MYVDARFDRKDDQIHVVERVNGKREYRTFPARYTFYYDDPKGKYRSVYGDPVSRIVCKNTKSFQKEKRVMSNKRLYESDVNPINQCLQTNYMDSPIPDLHICFWDIESSFDPKRGHAPPSDPFCAITAITVYLKWVDQLITVAVPPPSLSMADARKLCTEKWDNQVFLYETESEMLSAFLLLIEDADVLSGWNCSAYDIPYTINRISRVMSKSDTRDMCLWGQFPKSRTYERYGKEQKTYDLTGRVNMDYLDLYKKYTYEERASYKLDSIGELEVGERKTQYEGTLDQLYNRDFELFIEYNRQDVALLNKLDQKFAYIDLTIASAHENTVLMPATLGSVAIIEQAIINEAHLHGMVVPDKISKDDDTSMAGGYVGKPIKGIHSWIGSIDLNSLYPSTIRALNMAPETLIGQLRPTETHAHVESVLHRGDSFASAWEERFCCLEYQVVMDQSADQLVTIDWETGRSETMSGSQAYNLIFNTNKPWVLSANGTIFTTERKGVIPDLLTKWYSDRKQMQRQKKSWARMETGIELPERFL